MTPLLLCKVKAGAAASSGRSRTAALLKVKAKQLSAIAHKMHVTSHIIKLMATFKKKI